MNTSGFHSPLRGLATAFFLLALAAASPAWAQQDVQVDVRAEPRMVAPGERLTYQVNVSVEGNYDIHVSRNPDFGDFQVVGTSRAPSFYVQGGQAVRSLQLQFQLVAPSREGSYTIGPPQIVVGSRTLTPNAREVRVSSSARSTSRPSTSSGSEQDRSGETAFVEIALEPDRLPFAGEQVFLRYDLYVNQRQRGLRARPPGDPALDDFWVEELSQHVQGRRQMVRRDGQVWEVTPVRAMAIFPLRAGPATVDSVDIPVVRASFFGPNEEALVRGNPLEIEVQPLPDGAPEGFDDGNVGEWRLRVDVDSSSARVGGQLTLTARIEGTGRPGRLGAPQLAISEDFRVLSRDDATQQEIRNARVGGTRTFTYRLMPLTEGRVPLPELSFSYFDPDRKEYITLRSDPRTIDVEPGTIPEPAADEAPASVARGTSAPSTTILTELHDPLPAGALATTAPVRRPPWWLFLLPALGLLLLLVEPTLERRLSTRSAPARKKKRILAEVDELLAQAENPSGPDALLKALRHTLNEGLGTSLGALTVDDVQQATETLGLPVALQEQSLVLVDALIARRYAPGASQSTDDALQKRCLELIEELLLWQLDREKRAATPGAGAAALVVLLCAAAFVAAPPTAVANPVDDMLAAAHRAVEEASDASEWQDAANKWARLAESSDDPTFDFNAGTSAARAGDLGMARLHLERALLKGAHSSREVRDNLDQVIAAVSRQDASAAAFPAQEAASSGFQHLAPFAVVLLLWLAFFLALARRLTGHPRSRSIVLAMIASLVVLATATSACWLGLEEFSRNAELGVLLDDDQMLRSGPSHHAAPNNGSTLPPGAILRLHDQREGWTQVELPSGARGWLPTPAIEAVGPKTRGRPVSVDQL